jgi:hypothetical protein
MALACQSLMVFIAPGFKSWQPHGVLREASTGDLSRTSPCGRCYCCPQAGAGRPILGCGTGHCLVLCTHSAPLLSATREGDCGLDPWYSQEPRGSMFFFSMGYHWWREAWEDTVLSVSSTSYSSTCACRCLVLCHLRVWDGRQLYSPIN